MMPPPRRRSAPQPAPALVLGLALLLAGCASHWSVAFPADGAAASRFAYRGVAVARLVPIGVQHPSRDVDQASELLHRALRQVAPFPVWDELLEPRLAEPLQAPVVVEGRPIDAVLGGQIRFSRHDRSGWDRGSAHSGSAQGNPVFARRTAFRLLLRLELRELRTGRVALAQEFADELVYEGDGLGQERDAFGRLFSAALGRLVLALDPPPELEQRVLLPWSAGRRGYPP